jgi:hypothetical protein
MRGFACEGRDVAISATIVIATSETGILSAVSANAQTQRRNVRSKLAVSRGSPLLVRVQHPNVRRDLGQPIAADFPLA